MDKKDQITADLQVDLIADKLTDLTVTQMQRVNAFIEAGTPGIALIDESKMFRMLDLYLNGKSYTQISRMTNIEKDMVLYLSHKFSWTERKRDFLIDLNNNLQERLLETRLVSQNFLTDLAAFWHKKLGQKVTKYLTTGDEASAESVSKQDVAMYLKTLEMLAKATEENKGDGANKPSPVGLNLGAGVTVKKVGKDEVEITPKSRAIGSVLKELADLKRQDEKQRSDSKKSGNNEQ